MFLCSVCPCRYHATVAHPTLKDQEKLSPPLLPLPQSSPPCPDPGGTASGAHTHIHTYAYTQPHTNTHIHSHKHKSKHTQASQFHCSKEKIIILQSPWHFPKPPTLSIPPVSPSHSPSITHSAKFRSCKDIV